MVVENPHVIYCSYPPCVKMICKCGHIAYEGGNFEVVKSWEDRWDEVNKPNMDDFDNPKVRTVYLEKERRKVKK